MKLTATAALMAVLFGASFAYGEEDSADPLTPMQILNTAPDNAWRRLDPENTVYMVLPAGTVIIELRPDFAPRHVERIKALVREGFYDGLNFHRVIEGFMAQGGDPKGDGTGGSDKPDLAGEFARDSQAAPNAAFIGRDRIAPRVGFIDGMLIGAQPETLRTFRADRKVELWPLHCPGVMSMARSSSPNSANSQFFLMFGDARLNLDRRYTAWGWIVDGFEASRRISRGEPPGRPTPIMRMRIAADMAPAERREIEVLRTDSDIFMRYLASLEEVDETGYVKDICDIKTPVRIDGALKQ